MRYWDRALAAKVESFDLTDPADGRGAYLPAHPLDLLFILVIFDEEIERCKNNIDKHVRIRRCQASGGAVVDRLDSRAWIRGRKDASVCMCACPVHVVWCRFVSLFSLCLLLQMRLLSSVWGFPCTRFAAELPHTARGPAQWSAGMLGGQEGAGFVPNVCDLWPCRHTRAQGNSRLRHMS